MIKLIKSNPLISLIVFIALFLRIYGAYPGYPDIHPDESSSYSTAVYLLYNFLKPDRFDYPAGVPFINALAYITLFIPFYVLKIISYNFDYFLQFIFNPHNFFIQHKEEIFGNRDFYAMFWTRIVTAVFGGASVLLLYVAGKKLFNKQIGLFSAFFLAVNYLHVIRSHFGLPDVYNGFFVLASLYISALILEKNTTKRYLLAGLITGMAFALKYQVFSLIPFITVHIILTIRKRNILYFFHPNAILSALVFISTFLVINPYYLSNIDNAIRMNKQDIARYGMGQLGLRPFPYFYLYNWGIDKLPSLMVVLGIVFMLFRSTLRFFLIFPFTFAFMFFMTYYSQGGIFTRNFANVLPYLMLFAGYGMYSLINLFKNKFRNKTYSTIIILILLLGINFSSIKNSLTLGKYYSMPWNETKLGEWLRDELPKNTIVRNYQLFLHSVGGKAIQDKNITLSDWNYSKGPNSLAEFQEAGGDFAILNTSVLQSITYWWRGWSDPKLFLKYNEVPFDFIENDFYGLSIKEISRYTVFEAYKPWQAHHANNYVVYKIPSRPKDLGKKIADFTFDKEQDMWEIKGNFEGHSPIRVLWSGDDGHNDRGTLIATSSGVKSRAVSKPISVKEGKFYSVTGFIKTTTSFEGERDGFLRIDFYENKDKLDGIGEEVAISQRAFAKGEWEKVQAGMQVPKGAKFMTVSFQFKDAYFSSVVDDVEVFESDILPQERFKEIPYIKSTIPLESLYYNTFI